jgi:outer membrane immunogenic protein
MNWSAPMKPLILANLVLAGSAISAFAADAVVTPGPFQPPPAYGQRVVTPGPFEPPPAYPVAHVYDWTGFYVGLNGGGTFGNTQWQSVPNLVSGSSSLSGGLVGGTAGYNLQTGEPYVLGVEADIDWADLKATTAASACAPNGACEFQLPWIATVRLRFGYAFDAIMPYVTGGAVIGNLSADVVGSPFGTETTTNLGWTAGAGVEFVISGALRAKVEYLHADLNGFSCNAPCGGGPISFNVSDNIFRAGLNYRLWLH